MASPKKETWSTGDPYQKKLVAYAVVAIFVGVMAVLGVRSVSGPQMFEGDRLETLACKLCEGDGQEGSQRCRLCLGAGKLKAIIPGPAHPVEIRGSVRDAAAFTSPEQAQEVAAKEVGEMLKPVQGAVRGAHLGFEANGKTIEIEGKASGRFHCVLPPGTYQVSIQADGFKDLRQELVVPTRKKPVWPKRPGLDDSEETLRPVFLMNK